MSGLTRRFGFRTIDDLDDVWSADGYKFSLVDRHLLDALLQIAVETHDHTGTTASTTPGVPNVTQATTGGVLPAGRTVYYRYTIIDSRGIESRPSEVVSITTPTQLDRPPAPSVSLTASTTQRLGTYSYAITYVTGTATEESLLSERTTVVMSMASRCFRIAGPTAPAGIDFNVYRIGPGDSDWVFVGTGTGTYVDDDGSGASSLHRAPTANTTYTSNSVTLTFPAAIQAGTAVRLYRTFDATNWNDSLLVETTTSPYTDVGMATTTGAPPANLPAAASAPQVILSTETSGTFSLTDTHYPIQAKFYFPGLQQVGTYGRQYVIENTNAYPTSIRAWLGPGRAPVSQTLRVRILRRVAYNTGGWIEVTILDITTGNNSATYTFATPGDYHWVAGSCLAAQVIQAGGGATPNDYDLTVVVTMVANNTSPANPWG